MQKILEETELHSEILLKPNIIKRDSIKVLTAEFNLQMQQNSD